MKFNFESLMKVLLLVSVLKAISLPPGKNVCMLWLFCLEKMLTLRLPTLRSLEIIFLHGLMGYQWDALIELLERTNKSCLVTSLAPERSGQHRYVQPVNSSKLKNLLMVFTIIVVMSKLFCRIHFGSFNCVYRRSRFERIVKPNCQCQCGSSKW